MTILDTNDLLTNDMPILLKVLSRLGVSEKGSPCVLPISPNDRSLRSIYYNDRSHVPCPCYIYISIIALLEVTLAPYSFSTSRTVNIYVDTHTDMLSHNL